jgi:long-chain acyl-CoA synthetase
MDFALKDASPKVLIADGSACSASPSCATSTRSCKVIAVRPADDTPAWAERWDDCYRGGVRSCPRRPSTRTATPVFLHLGHHGRPKGAQLTHRGCVANVMNVAFINTVQPRALAYAAGVEPAGAGRRRAGAGAPGDAPVSRHGEQLRGPGHHPGRRQARAHVQVGCGGGPAADRAERITAFSAVPMMTRELLIHPDFGPAIPPR